jgi:lipopolysaccharide export system permease protein
MLLISKIIAKEWFKALMGSIIVLFLLVTVGDIINGFLRNYSAQRVFLEYVLKLPELAGKMLPISALLASLFAVNRLKTHSELMAILAGGFSAQRIYALILLCSFSVGMAQYINLGHLVPLANKVKREHFEKSRKNESKYLARSEIGKGGLIWYKSGNYFTSFKAFDSKNKVLKDVSVYFLGTDGLLDSVYKAKSAQFLKEDKWNLKDISIMQSLQSKSFPSITSAKNLIVRLKESPKDFSQFESDITTLSIGDLGQFINRLHDTDINSAEYEVMYFEKISLALICVVFSLFPLSAIFNPNRRASGFGKSVVFTLIFSIFFWLIHSGAVTLGNSSKIPASVATLGIPGIFTLYILYKFLKNRSL